MEPSGPGRLREHLSELSRDMEAAAPDSLFRVRRSLLQLSLPELAQVEDRRAVLVAYLLTKIVRDIWYNLGTDAMFDFPDTGSLADLSRSLGGFVRLALEGSPGGDQGALDSVASALVRYYSLVADYEGKALKGELDGGDPRKEAEPW